MEWIEHLELGLSNIAKLAKLCIEAISIFCVILGILQTGRLAISTNTHSFNHLRLYFGMWLQLALELQLGADILATTVAPTLEALYKLAIVAVIRTFLNYFLNREFAEQLTTSRINSSPAKEIGDLPERSPI